MNNYIKYITYAHLSNFLIKHDPEDSSGLFYTADQKKHEKKTDRNPLVSERV